MAITKSAKKAVRSQERKRVYNLRVKRTMVGAVKSAGALTGVDRKEQQASLSTAYQAIDKAMKRGVIKKNTAARKKARLAKRLKNAAK